MRSDAHSRFGLVGSRRFCSLSSSLSLRDKDVWVCLHESTSLSVGLLNHFSGLGIPFHDLLSGNSTGASCSSLLVLKTCYILQRSQTKSCCETKSLLAIGPSTLRDYGPGAYGWRASVMEPSGARRPRHSWRPSDLGSEDSWRLCVL